MDHPGATKEAEQPKWQQVGQRSFAVQITSFVCKYQGPWEKITPEENQTAQATVVTPA